MTPGDYIVTKEHGFLKRRASDRRAPFRLYPGARVTYHGHGVVTCGEIKGTFVTAATIDFDPTFFRPHTT